MSTGRDDDAAAGGRQPGVELQCELCHHPFRIAPDGWAYRYSQIVMHMVRCSPEASPEERDAAARAMANRG